MSAAPSSAALRYPGARAGVRPVMPPITHHDVATGAAAQARGAAAPAVNLVVDGDAMEGRAEALQWALVSVHPSNLEGMAIASSAASKAAIDAILLRGLLREAGRTGHVYRHRAIDTHHHALPMRLVVYTPDALASVAAMSQEAIEKFNVHVLSMGAFEDGGEAETEERHHIAIIPDDTPAGEVHALVKDKVDEFRSMLSQAGKVVIVLEGTPGMTKRQRGVVHHGYTHLHGGNSETASLVQQALDDLRRVKYVCTEEAFLPAAADLGEFLEARPPRKVLVPTESVLDRVGETFEAPRRMVNGIPVDTLIADTISAPFTARSNAMMDARTMQVSPSFLRVLSEPWVAGVRPGILAPLLQGGGRYVAYLLRMIEGEPLFLPVTQEVYMGGDAEARTHVAYMASASPDPSVSFPTATWMLFRDLSQVQARATAAACDSTIAARVYLREVEESQWAFVQSGLALSAAGVLTTCCPRALAARVQGATTECAALARDTVRSRPVAPHAAHAGDRSWFLSKAPVPQPGSVLRWEAALGQGHARSLRAGGCG